MDNLSCNDKQYYLFFFCISYEDLFLIIINIIAVLVITVWLLIHKFLLRKEKFKSIYIKSNFCLLGEGVLSCFYINESSNKVNTRKKATKGVSEVKNDKNNFELKCVFCGRTVDLSYQNTISKLMPS